MKEELDLKIDKLIELLDNDFRIIKLIEEKNELLNDKELIDKINELKILDKYSSEYKKIKNEVFSNSNFVLFKELENEINYLILEINSKLRVLTNERRCKSESN